MAENTQSQTIGDRQVKIWIADGKLRPCLLDDKSIDIKTLFRNNADDKLLVKVISDAVQLKPEIHLPFPLVDTNGGYRRLAFVT